MTRERMIEILAQELERSEKLPLNAPKLIAELRDGKHGPGLEAALRAMERVDQER